MSYFGHFLKIKQKRMAAFKKVLFRTGINKRKKGLFKNLLKEIYNNLLSNLFTHTKKHNEPLFQLSTHTHTR